MEALPEERVRQGILTHLLNVLGYPLEGIAVERQLSELPYLRRPHPPNRRIDILCFDVKTLSPLLLIECKGVALKERMTLQLMGYNEYIGAELICLANEREYLLKRWDGSPLTAIPSYESLSSS